MNRAGTWSVDVGNCVELLKTLPDDSIDSIVTDPPAGIGFMGKTWDTPTSYGYSDGAERASAPPTVNLARNPTCQVCGGRKRAGAATKGCTCESPSFNDAALVNRDRDAFVTFIADVMRECMRVLKPGGHALVWALPRTSHWTTTGIENAGFEIRDVITHHFGSGFPKSLNLGGGWGTALKPASEHWILARKPLIGTLAKNIAAHGTGGLNIDGTRIAADEGRPLRDVTTPGKSAGVYGDGLNGSRAVGTTTTGRWPANLILSHGDDCVEGACGPGCPVADMDASSEEVGPSRFFYQAKPPRKEKEAGLDAFPARSAGEATDREDGSDGLKSPRAGAGRTGGAKNFHPTVKSVNLMRWLCRLITPPDGVVLDPFTGSGSTGCAALAEGFYFVGYEQDPEYAEIARARIKHYEGT